MYPLIFYCISYLHVHTMWEIKYTVWYLKFILYVCDIMSLSCGYRFCCPLRILGFLGGGGLRNNLFLFYIGNKLFFGYCVSLLLLLIQIVNYYLVKQLKLLVCLKLIYLTPCRQYDVCIYMYSQ